MLYRVRRVKCDERKPLCLRCDKFGVQCDGYEDYSLAPVSRERKPAALLPSTSVGLSIYRPSSTTGFETQEEYQYFLHYRNQTVIDLSGAMPEEVWSQVIPRANVGHMAIRNLTLAVSAMNKARNSSSPVPHSQFGVRIILSYRTAGAQYEQSLPGTMYCTRTPLNNPPPPSIQSDILRNVH
jgi:hypothetical protein